MRAQHTRRGIRIYYRRRCKSSGRRASAMHGNVLDWVERCLTATTRPRHSPGPQPSPPAVTRSALDGLLGVKEIEELILGRGAHPAPVDGHVVVPPATRGFEEGDDALWTRVGHRPRGGLAYETPTVLRAVLRADPLGFF